MNPENQPFIISHAQNREDIILSGFFNGVKDGFYVDVGANDPALDSVTKNFYERGWNGINIEPIKRLHTMLNKARPRDINLNIGISDVTGKMKFREYKEYHGLSTFADNIKKDYDKLTTNNEKYKDYTEYSVEIKTLAQVFKEQNVEVIDFLKIDVEGYEYEVLNGNDWKKYRPQVICIESNHIAKDWRPILKDKKYDLVFFDGLNNYYVANESIKVKQSFSYVQTMLPTPIIDYRVMGILEYYKRARLETDAVNIALNNEMHSLKHDLYVTKQEYVELSRFRGLIKALGYKLNSVVEEMILPNNIVIEPAPSLPTKEIVMSSNNPHDILESIKLYDSQNLTKLNPPKHVVRYAILQAYRKVIVHGLKKTAVLTYKLLRKASQLIRR